MKTFSGLRSALVLALAGLAFGADAAYPDQPIKIVVPYSVGGSSDVIARAIGDELGKELGQPIIVENRAGAGSMIGTQYVSSEAPNGYTLLLVDVPFTIVPALYGQRAKYNPEKDFTPIALVGQAPAYLFVSASSPVKTPADLVKLAKASPETVSIGSGGNGSLTHLMAALFMINTDTRLVHIPYKGAFASITDLAAGQIDSSFTTMPTAKGLYQAHKLRAIAVSSARRTAEAPDVPTFQERGIPNMSVESWWGLVAAAGTNPAVAARLGEAVRKVLQIPRVKARMDAVGVTVPADTRPGVLQALVKADTARWRNVVQRAQIKPD